MAELTWLSAEAHKIHNYFQGIFYLFITTLLLLGIVFEFFKLPLGGKLPIVPLVGRCLIAAILMHSYPQVANTIFEVTSALSKQLGELAEFKLALNKMGERIDTLTWSWTSVRQSVIVAISFLSFFLLFFSVHLAQALYLYTSVLLYIFSPILIGLFVLPATAPATTGLYRSLIEVSLWKPVWCVIATIIWSTGVSDIQGTGSPVSFLSAICFCLIAASSLLSTPMVVHSLASGAVSAMAQNLGSIGVPGIGSITPAGAVASGIQSFKRFANTGISLVEVATRPSPKVNFAVQHIPKWNLAKRPPLLKREEPKMREKGFSFNSKTKGKI